jgi:hypothetical protein
MLALVFFILTKIKLLRYMKVRKDFVAKEGIFDLTLRNDKFVVTSVRSSQVICVTSWLRFRFFLSPAFLQTSTDCKLGAQENSAISSFYHQHCRFFLTINIIYNTCKCKCVDIQRVLRRILA